MITAKEITAEIKQAIKQFGEYSYHDKGPQEVMDVDAIRGRMSDMSAEQIADMLAEVRGYHKASGEGERFVETMLCLLDDRRDLDALYADERVNDLY